MALLPVLLLGALVGVLWALPRRSVLEVGTDEHADVVSLHRHLSRWRLAGLVAAVVVIVSMVVDVPHPHMAWGRTADLGRTAALVPVIGGLSILLGTVVGELTARPVKATLRTATVETRRVGDILPDRLRATIGIGWAALVSLLVIGSLMGTADDLGRPGRTLRVNCAAPVGPRDAGWLASSSTGPWPGTFYTVPIALGLCLVLATAGVAVAGIVRRPRPSATAAALDTRLRRHAGRNVLLALGLVAFGTLGPVAATMADAMAGNDCRPMWWVVPAWALAGVAVGAAAVGAWCLLNLLVNPVLHVRETKTGTSAQHGGATPSR